MTLEQIEAYILLAKKHKLDALKVDGLEISLWADNYVTDKLETNSRGVQPSVEESPVSDTFSTQAIGLDKGVPTDEELLYWSSQDAISPIRTTPPKE